MEKHRSTLRLKKHFMNFEFLAPKNFLNFRMEANSARIPPQTPPACGTEAEAGRIHIPRQLFRPAESALVLLKKSSRKVYNYSTNKFIYLCEDLNAGTMLKIAIGDFQP